ncbi:DUF2249 domain-containing protein [Eleftheria terrae]|uniref:DUF2249 domain-containing protein n=1 Tax=Eleftheria terrae TaxID=1597781 RepID=UPI00263A69D3|nr:DUF2249 domain-containing protein [Eleftheria terrae]WKB55399.1 DUF2249 domain-containing protein [Eleftheria terrae]
MSQTAPALIDVRLLSPRERHPLIFSTFAALPPGGALELVNDHNPRPLYSQFQANWPGAFVWQDLEQGPEVWRVRISRSAPAGQCCGSCGG